MCVGPFFKNAHMFSDEWKSAAKAARKSQSRLAAGVRLAREWIESGKGPRLAVYVDEFTTGHAFDEVPEATRT